MLIECKCEFVYVHIVANKGFIYNHVHMFLQKDYRVISITLRKYEPV